MLAALSHISVKTSMVWIGSGLTVFGLGVGTAMTSAMDAVLGALPKAEAGAGSGVTNTVRQVAGALGVAILGSVLSSSYRDGLDAAMLQKMSAQSASTVRGSIVGATQIAHQLGAAGPALNQMAGVSYTHAMSVLLVVCAAVGIAAAIVSGLVLRRRPVAVAGGQRARVAAIQES
jgi:DHA2 family multidrug resistance protein-like MFS transporter